MKNEKTLAAAIVANGNLELFKRYSSAQENLNGRTHYVDAGTLRFFHSRIISEDVTAENLIFWIVESAAKDYENKSRGFRFVAFDLFGTVLGRPNLENMARTKEKARADFWAWFNEFDTLAHYSSVFEKQAEKAKKQALEFKNLARAAKVRKVSAKGE